jgi:O-antigen/teichoic acid export membrane protein
MVLIYAAAGEPLLRAVFGDDLTEASGALPWLGLAMALLACVYLTVQYLLAMGHRRFIFVLAAAAVAEVVVLVAVGADLTGIALALFLLQASCAVLMLADAFRTSAPAGHAAQLD